MARFRDIEWKIRYLIHDVKIRYVLMLEAHMGRLVIL